MCVVWLETYLQKEVEDDPKFSHKFEMKKIPFYHAFYSLEREYIISR